VLSILAAALGAGLWYTTRRPEGGG
jgi:hypothetical protein